jgi:hypothetical protein
METYQGTIRSSPAPREKWGRILLLFSLLGFLLGGFAKTRHNYLLDDAYITYRYARNLANGFGMVYNPGERILGTSTPLYTLFLAGGIKIGLAPPLLSRIVDWIAFGLLFFVLLNLVSEAGFGLWWLWFGTFFLSDSFPVTLIGMETWLYALFIYGSFWALLRDKAWWASFGTALAALIRPDGLCVAVIVFPLLFLKRLRRENKEKRAYVYALLAGIGLLFAGYLILTLYFGSWLPNSVSAKRIQSEIGSIWSSYRNVFYKKHFYPGGIPKPFFLLIITGLLQGLIYHPRVRPLLVWGIVYQCAFFLGKAPWYGWYEVPVLPVIVLCHTIFWYSIAGRLNRLLNSQNSGKVRSRIYAGVILVSLLVCAVINRYSLILWGRLLTFTPPSTRTKGYDKAGKWLAENADPRAEAAAIEIGILGYYCPQRIYDLMGLVSPQALGPLRKISIWDQVCQRGSDYFLYPFPNRAGEFQPVPSKLFFRDYRIRNWWAAPTQQGVLEVSVLFQRVHPDPLRSQLLVENLSHPLRGQESGITLINQIPHTALKGYFQKGSHPHITWSFRADKKKCLLRFLPYTQPLRKWEGGCIIYEFVEKDVKQEIIRFKVCSNEHVQQRFCFKKENPLIQIALFPDNIDPKEDFYLLDAVLQCPP